MVKGKNLMYCKDARKVLKRNVICGIDCPIYDRCPRLILEDATDKAITEAMEAMIKIAKEG